MIITLLCYLPSVLCLVLLGLGILLKNRHNPAHFSFFALAIIIALWLLGLCVSYIHLTYGTSLWALRCAVGVGSFIAPALIYFSIFFPSQLKKIHWSVHGVVLIPAFIFFIISISSIMIPAITFRQYSVAIHGVSAAYTLQTLYEAGGIIAAFAILFWKSKHVSARQKTQIRLVAMGLVVAAVVNIIANFLLVLLHAASYLSDLFAGLSLVVFVGTTAYAIVRHRLFDMRLAIARAVAFVLTITVISILYSLMIFALFVFLSKDHAVRVSYVTQLLFFLPPTILIGVTTHSIHTIVARVTRNIFFQDAYDPRTVLEKLSDVLISYSDMNSLASHSLRVLGGAIRPTNDFCILADKSSYFIAAGKGPKPRNVKVLLELARQSGNKILLKDNDTTDTWPAPLDEASVALVVPLRVNGAFVGAVYFGPHQNGRSYTLQDLEMLSVGAKSFGIAIENAKKYEQISKFADTLHAEVLHATADLRRANETLQTLDVLKDDFISMVSHQLRSPATSVRDAIKMLEQGYLKPEERARIIKLADASSERLVNVITDMLSVARIQAGHFTVEKTAVDIGELVDRAVLQASALAKEKHITVVIQKPEGETIAQVDRAKLNETMANYIENAIRYSPDHGTVHVALSASPERIDFSVHDEGIGVPKSERKQLFTKFYRGSNARREQPNGSGIGLFVVKTIIAEHDGDVYYTPAKPGSRFGFWVPIQG